MQSLVNELARKLSLSPEEAEAALSAVLVRIRAGLETIGEVEIEGLGTFRSSEDAVTFEPAVALADEINKEFAGMNPVALTSTGESVDLTDKRALPGADPVEGDGFGEVVPESSSAAGEETPGSGSYDDDLDSERMSFESPPPPFPSRIRVPPSERRSSRGSRARSREESEFPEMGPVVTTRPVQPIRTAPVARPRSKAPALIAVGVVAVGLVWWLMIGGGGSKPTADAAVAVAPEGAVPERTPDESGAGAENNVPVADEPGAEPENEPAMESEAELLSVESPGSQVIDSESSGPEVAEPEVAESEVAEQEVASGPVSGPIYSWIVASFTSKSEADGRVNLLRDSGFDADVYEATVRGKPAYRVGVGRFESEASALRSHTTIPPEAADAWITRVK
ncbi:MAG TPA: SPOR domain-containing protein [Rhodothermales bacterium]|nr:SPOR domain-containing protein [Rhodothermales bacterium]